MNKTLHPFQSVGSSFLASNFHALLADEPGLGKTIQAIAAVEAVDATRVLVVCPASVRLNWRQEIRECLGANHRCVWDVISYHNATSSTRRDQLWGAYDVIILDEAHFLKTPDSQRTQAIFGNGERGLARRAKYIWALTGTPVLNRPRELYPVLKTLSPNFASMSYAAYAQRYCGAFFDGRSLNDKGATHLEELADKLKGFMLRRTKKEVMPELPPKVFSRVPLDVTAEDLIDVRAEEDLIVDRPAKLSTIHEDFSALGDMSRLLRLTGMAKARAAVEFLEELIDGGVSKVVVFARHRDVITSLEKGLALRKRKAAVYHGGMSDDQKMSEVERFKKDPTLSVFIGQIQAAGVGINGLQEVASHVVFAELSWVPGETGQAVDRCHRIGQPADSVNVYLLHAPGTLESAVLAVHDGKEKVIARLMGDGLVGAL